MGHRIKGKKRREWCVLSGEKVWGPEELKEGISLSQEDVCVQAGNMPASEVTENPV